MKISFLFDMDTLTDRSAGYEHLVEVLEELCCDEYYTWFDEISDEFLTKFLKTYGKRQFTLIIQLLTRCSFNNSILAFEYLLDKYKSMVSFKIYMDCIQGGLHSCNADRDTNREIVQNMHKLGNNYEFVKYMLAPNPDIHITNELAKVLLHKCCFNKHMKTLELLYDTCKFCTDILENCTNLTEHTDTGINVDMEPLEDYIEWLSNFMRAICEFTQVKVMKYVLDKNKCIIEYIVQYNGMNKPIQALKKTFYKTLRGCIIGTSDSNDKSVYNVNSMYQMLDLLLETFGYDMFASLMSRLEFVCFDQGVLEWFENKGLQFSNNFVEYNLDAIPNINCNDRTFCLFRKVVDRKAHRWVHKVYANGEIQYMNKDLTFQWVHYYLSRIDFGNREERDKCIDHLLTKTNEYVAEYLLRSGLYEMVPDLEQTLTDREAWRTLEQYLYWKLIRTRGKFIECYGERYERGRLKFL